VEAFALRDTKSETIAKIFVNEVICRHSAPSSLLSDQGANFLSNLIKQVCEYLKINKVNTAPYNPKCDGLTERANKTLCQMLAAYSNANQTNWDLYFPLVLFAYRTSEQSTTKESPFALLYSREPRLADINNFKSGPSEFIENLHERWMEAKRHIVKQAEVNKKAYDSKYDKELPVYIVKEFIRVKQPQTRTGFKKSYGTTCGVSRLRLKK
jgi:transposase InsO family protein